MWFRRRRPRRIQVKNGMLEVAVPITKQEAETMRDTWNLAMKYAAEHDVSLRIEPCPE